MSEPKDKKVSGSEYLKYSGIAFQLAGIVFFSYYIGSKIDIRMGNEVPYITILLILATFCTYLYKLYKELMK